jgi:glycosyltransferase involved in cell wall biosynthesis
MVSAFAPYKRIDLAVEAFRRLGLPLVIIGKGQSERTLRRQAKGAPNVRFLGGLSNESLGEFYRKARAMIFPGLEDFGITPLESLYNGRPVIAYGRGGLLDTVTPDTGIFFSDQSVEGLMAAVKKCEAEWPRFSPAVARARAEEFRREVFQKEYGDFLAAALAGRA